MEVKRWSPINRNFQGLQRHSLGTGDIDEIIFKFRITLYSLLLLIIEVLRDYNLKRHDHVAAALFARSQLLESEPLQGVLLVVSGAWLERDFLHAFKSIDFDCAAKNSLRHRDLLLGVNVEAIASVPLVGL